MRGRFTGSVMPGLSFLVHSRELRRSFGVCDIDAPSDVSIPSTVTLDARSWCTLTGALDIFARAEAPEPACADDCRRHCVGDGMVLATSAWGAGGVPVEPGYAVRTAAKAAVAPPPDFPIPHSLILAMGRDVSVPL